MQGASRPIIRLTVDEADAAPHRGLRTECLQVGCTGQDFDRMWDFSCGLCQDALGILGSIEACSLQPHIL